VKRGDAYFKYNDMTVTQKTFRQIQQEAGSKTVMLLYAVIQGKQIFTIHTCTLAHNTNLFTISNIKYVTLNFFALN
jgi:hypothetical protein